MLDETVRQQIDEIAERYPKEFYLCSVSSIWLTDLKFVIQCNFQDEEEGDFDMNYKELCDAIEKAFTDYALHEELQKYMLLKIKVPSDEEFADYIPMISPDTLSDRIEWGEDPLCGNLVLTYNGMTELEKRYTTLLKKYNHLKQEFDKLVNEFEGEAHGKK